MPAPPDAASNPTPMPMTASTATTKAAIGWWTGRSIIGRPSSGAGQTQRHAPRDVYRTRVATEFLLHTLSEEDLSLLQQLIFSGPVPRWTQLSLPQASFHPWSASSNSSDRASDHGRGSGVDWGRYATHWPPVGAVACRSSPTGPTKAHPRPSPSRREHAGADSRWHGTRALPAFVRLRYPMGWNEAMKFSTALMDPLAVNVHTT